MAFLMRCALPFLPDAHRLPFYGAAILRQNAPPLLSALPARVTAITSLIENLKTGRRKTGAIGQRVLRGRVRDAHPTCSTPAHRAPRGADCRAGAVAAARDAPRCGTSVVYAMLALIKEFLRGARKCVSLSPGAVQYAKDGAMSRQRTFTNAILTSSARLFRRFFCFFALTPRLIRLRAKRC